MGPGDIDRELCELRDSLKAGWGLNGAMSGMLLAGLRRAFDLGRDHSESVHAADAVATETNARAGGGITIHRVEIVVTSDQPPSRIARALKAALENVDQRDGA